MADRQLMALRVASNQLLLPLARAAVAFVKCEAWVPIGYGLCSDFTRTRLGRSSRWLGNLAALGKGLAEFPALRSALCGEDGATPLSRVAATALARFATVDTVDAWIQLARCVTVREFLESLRAARLAGSKQPLEPSSPGGDSDAPIQMLSSEVGGDESEDECADLQSVRLPVPEAIRIAFDEVHELHRAVNGHEASTASFVDALVAEAQAGPYPVEACVSPTGPGVSMRDIELAHARATDNWRSLSAATDAAANVFLHGKDRGASPESGAETARSAPTDTPSLYLQCLVEAVLLEVRRLESEAGEGGEAELADQLARCVRLENEIERCTGRILRRMGQRDDWQALGFAGAGHYAQERLGMPRRTAESRTNLDRALCQRPHVKAAYDAGEIGLEATWLICRVLDRKRISEKTEVAWIERARTNSVKRLRDDLRLVKWKALESPEGAAAREPRPPSDEEWLASIGRAPEMTRDRVRRLGKIALDSQPADVFLRLRLPQDIAENLFAAIESARQRLQHDAVQHLLETVESTLERIRKNGGTVAGNPFRPDPSLRISIRAARHFAIRCRRLPPWVGLLSLLEDYAETWDDPQLIPKRRWSRIYERDGYRCMAPGCTARRQIQDHHVQYRSHRGSDDFWNQLSLCRFHHLQGEHGRFAQVRGRAPLDIIWRLGRPDLATWWKNERRLDGPPEDWR